MGTCRVGNMKIKERMAVEVEKEVAKIMGRHHTTAFMGYVSLYQKNY